VLSFDKCSSKRLSLSHDSSCSSSNSSLALLHARSQNQELCSDVNNQNSTIRNQNHLSVLQLAFSQGELATCTSFSKVGLTKMSQHWINKSAEILWSVTNGAICQATLNSLRNCVLNKYTCNYARARCSTLQKRFLSTPRKCVSMFAIMFSNYF
jgi:hypothetical protein